MVAISGNDTARTAMPPPLGIGVRWLERWLGVSNTARRISQAVIQRVNIQALAAVASAKTNVRPPPLAVSSASMAASSGVGSGGFCPDGVAPNS